MNSTPKKIANMKLRTDFGHWIEIEGDSMRSKITYGAIERR